MKNIVIVGGSSGIGLAVIQNLSGEAITNISRTPCAVAGVQNLTADVADQKSIDKAFSKIDKIDVLIYCAGTSLAAPVEYLQNDDLQNVFDVNLFGAFHCCKKALPLLKKSEDGKIIILSSSGGVAPIAFDAPYSASKAGVNALCYALRLEAPSVQSTAVVIGGVQTQFSFKRKIYQGCGEYDKPLKTATDALIKIEQTGYSADDVAKRIVKLVHADVIPPVKTVGLKNAFLTWLYGILPRRAKLYALRKMYNLKDED